MRFLFRLIVICGVLALGTMVLANLAERWLIYPLESTRVSPAEAGLRDVTEHEIPSGDDNLIVWSHPPDRGQPVIFYLHGNAGNLAARAGRFQRFLDRGYGLVALAYPGSSGSSGTPSEDLILRQASSVWIKKDNLLPLTYIPPSTSRTILYGESIGAAVAIALNASVASDPVKSAGPADAIILEAPFTSIPAMAEHHYPGTGELAKMMENQWNSLKWATRMHQPLLILHGTNDDLIPIEMGRQIHAAAPSGRKHFLAVPGAGHTDLWRSDTLPRLWAFIDQFALR